MAEKLTPQQSLAVNNRGGKLLVSAAAGSGKTKVLVDRLLKYLNDPVSPANVDEFLIITFTEAAAAELRSKIASKLNEKIAEDPANKHLQKQLQRLYLAKISTVHSFCSGVLKEYAYRLDLPADFRLADENEANELKHKIVELVFDNAYQNADPDFLAFVDSQGLGRNDYMAPEIVLDIFEKSRCHLNPNAWLDQCVDSADISDTSDAAETVWGRYLIEDLHRHVDLLIQAMENCVALVKNDPTLAKVELLLLDNVDLLRDLRNRNTWSEIIAGRDLSFGTLRFPKEHDSEIKESISAVRDRCKKILTKKLGAFTDTNEQTLLDLGKTEPVVKGIVSIVKRFSETYAAAKRQRRIVDFSDLEHFMLDLLLGKNRDSLTVIAEELGERFQEVMVDEYQDTNEVQDRIFDALTRKRQNCFMVGDVKQSIYQFRLADPGIFLDKYNSYTDARNAKAGEGRKVLLSSNFRSSGGVIDAVNHVFSEHMTPSVGGLYYSGDEILKEGIPHKELHEPEVEFYAVDVSQDRYTEEANLVAQRICDLLDGTHMVRDGDDFRPVVPDDIVILLRSPGSVGGEYQTALEKCGVRCVREKSNDLLKTEEISVLRSILQIISNPLQDIPLAAVLCSRVIGVSIDDIAQIRAANKSVPFFEALRTSELQSAKDFISLLTKLRADARVCSLTQLIDQVLFTTSMDTIYGAMSDGDRRVDNIFLFCQLASAFEANRQGDLDRFLEYLDNLEQGNGYAVSEDNTSGAVRIMSIHKSKGLEFPVVFVSALSKRFNDEDSKAPVLCDKDLGLGTLSINSKLRIKYPNIARKAIADKIRNQSFSEEMRVLYVALTRAKDRLIMTYSRQGIEKYMDDLARRMKIMPAELMSLDVPSAGDWVLLTALKRREGSKLLSNPVHFDVPPCDTDKWLIELVTDQNSADYHETDETLAFHSNGEDIADMLVRRMTVDYSYALATKAPSKQTATQLKGRAKDFEAHERTQSYHPYSFRKPVFAGNHRVSATAYGNAMHTLMQHVQFDNCVSEEGVISELRRIEEMGFLSAEDRELINVKQVVSFFSTTLGQKLRKSENVLREFKFSILDDGQRYVPGLMGEKVLVQGVVDCAIIEDDGITILDFKTDKVAEDSLSDAVLKYTPQIKLYANAMERIYRKPIKATALYFFRLGKTVFL